jgi:hypothetical protein
MEKSKAMLMEEKIRRHYTYNDKCYINSADISDYLMHDEIDDGTSVLYKTNGMDISDDKSLCVFHYDDNSVLIVGHSVGLTTNG